MTTREILKLVLKPADGEKYYRPGIDNVARLFLHSIKENKNHQRRREMFKNYNGYEPRY